MRFMISIALIVLLSACTSITKNYYTPTIHNWRGGNITDFLKAWGLPDKKITKSDGHNIYIYYTESYHGYSTPASPMVGLHVNAMGNPVLTSPNTNMTWNRGNMSTPCFAIFEVARGGTIVDTQIQGNNCYMNAVTAQKLSR